MEPSLVLYGLARAWDQTDEFLCRWNAEELGLQWPTREPGRARRYRPRLRQLLRQIREGLAPIASRDERPETGVSIDVGLIGCGRGAG